MIKSNMFYNSNQKNSNKILVNAKGLPQPSKKYLQNNSNIAKKIESWLSKATFFTIPSNKNSNKILFFAKGLPQPSKNLQINSNIARKLNLDYQKQHILQFQSKNGNKILFNTKGLPQPSKNTSKTNFKRKIENVVWWGEIKEIIPVSAH